MLIKAIPKVALDFIANEEALRLRAYKDIGGVLTIGFGHTGEDVFKGREITEDEAYKLLEEDMSKAAAAVCRLTKISLNDNQYSSLLSFVYNVGAGAYQRSTLRQRINVGDFSNILYLFRLWSNVKSRRSKGLFLRRTREAELFMS